MIPQESLYQILGCSPTATQDEIKHAYRKKAIELHPDRNDSANSTEQFQQLVSAYEILKAPEKRATYDRFGLQDDQLPTNPTDQEKFEIITQIFGFGRSKKPPTGDKVSPTIRMIRVPLEKIYSGGDWKIKIKINCVCQECDGIGSINKTQYPICSTCEGAGSLSPLVLSFLFPCSDCNSVGYLIPKDLRCKRCKGRKIVLQKKNVLIPIIRGIDSGEIITLKNVGDEYPGKENADLQAIIMMENHSDFIRDGDDLIFIKKLSVYELKKGTSFVIHCLSGHSYNVCTEKKKPIDLNVVKWIPNEGMIVKGLNEVRGNLFIVFQKALYEPLSQSFLMIKNAINSLQDCVLLEDAPIEIQEKFRDGSELN